MYYIIYINIYRGATLALNPSTPSNSTSGAVKFPQMRQLRQLRQLRQIPRVVPSNGNMKPYYQDKRGLRLQ